MSRRGPVQSRAGLGTRAGERAEPSRVPAERTAARRLRQALDREPDVLALDRLAHELVVDPAPAVAHHLVAGLDDRPRRLRVPFERHRDGEEADRDPALGEEAHEPPEAGAATVLVDRLHLEIAHAAERLGADHLPQEGLRFGVAVEDRSLAALLVVDDDLQGQARLAGPLRIGWGPAVADQVTGIGHPLTRPRRPRRSG